MGERREQGHPGVRIVISSTPEPPNLSEDEALAVAAIRERRRQEERDRAEAAAGGGLRRRLARAARAWFSLAGAPRSRDDVSHG